MADPVIAERRRAALRASQQDPAKALSRSMGARRAAAKRAADPVQREALARVMREKIRPKASTPEALAKRDYAALGRKLQARWLAWCPEELRGEYQRLRRSKGMGAAAAQEIILAHAARSPRPLTFEEKLARVAAGAPIARAQHFPYRAGGDHRSLTGGSLS